jgi:hypothetical protein
MAYPPGSHMTYEKLSDTFGKGDPPAPPAAKAAKVAKAEGSQGFRAETGLRKFAQVAQSDRPENPAEPPGFATFATFAAPAADPALFVRPQPFGIDEWQRGVSRLDIDRPLNGVPHCRWQTFVANAARFLAGPFAEPAATLGWTALDLFGCDPDRPFARIDHLGLLWLLGGGRLVALTANTATIEFPTGSRQIWRRRSSGPGRVLAWQLAGR